MSSGSRRIFDVTGFAAAAVSRKELWMMIQILPPPLAIFVLLAAPIEAPEAKPKKTYSGCTQQQLQTPEAGRCLDTMQDDRKME